MCEKCEEIDAKIARYRQLLAGVDDPNAIALVDLVVTDLKSEKVKLHQEDT